jgi:hypothetical protein
MLTWGGELIKRQVMPNKLLVCNRDEDTFRCVHERAGLLMSSSYT